MSTNYSLFWILGFIALIVLINRLFPSKPGHSPLFDTQKALEALEQRTTQLLQQGFFQNQQALSQSLDKMSDTTHERHLKNIEFIQKQLKESLNHTADTLGKRVQEISQVTERHLLGMTTRVEQRLQEGFEKTTTTFTQVVERLAIIDEAQKQITQLSTNVVSLQEILSDKRSRGAFGEVQLSALLRNVMPENTFALQHTLSNHLRADCILFLPEPTGNVVIDSKFPLESFKTSHNTSLSSEERTLASQQFKRDVQKHIQDISSKYILPPETADGAVMFIPAEAIFAEIHANHPDVVEMAHRAKVWIASPTTMMAILTTARAVLKDAATRKQVHIIQEHLGLLAKDFSRFEKRMASLSKNIEKAHTDASQVHMSAKKITSRFGKIERVDLGGIESEDPQI